MIDLERLVRLVDKQFWWKHRVLADLMYMDATSLAARLKGRIPWRADELQDLFKILHLTKEEAESVLFPDSYQKEMGWKHD